jgi:hypothetical protein
MRQGRDTAWRAPLTGSRFYTGCTQRIPQRSRLRRGFIPRSPVACRRGSNDFKRFDRRGELLLRVVRVGRVRGVWDRVRSMGADRDSSAGDHHREHLRLHGHSSDAVQSAPSTRRRTATGADCIGSRDALHNKPRHRFFLLVGRCLGGASAASISSMLGKLPLSASGSFSTNCVSQSATPIGLR